MPGASTLSGGGVLGDATTQGAQETSSAERARGTGNENENVNDVGSSCATM